MSGYVPFGNSQSLRISPDLAHLFRDAPDMKKAVTGTVSSNLSYIGYLEEGTSKMPARPVLGEHLAEYKDMLEEELTYALRSPQSYYMSAKEGVSLATLRIMAAMANRTAQPAGPYFTGRAKNSWTATLPGGRTVPSGPVITAEMQRAIIKNRFAGSGKRRIEKWGSVARRV